MVIALLLPGVEQANTPARRIRCKNNLKMVGLALRNYHDNCFPSARPEDAQRKPADSWRVQLLPFLEEQELYVQYRLDEP